MLSTVLGTKKPFDNNKAFVESNMEKGSESKSDYPVWSRDLVERNIWFGSEDLWVYPCRLLDAP